MPSKLVASAPARADFLNTHQDYKGLPVVPVALDLRTYLTAKPADGNTITIKSEDLERLHERSTDSFQVKQNEILEKGFFGNYFRGALNVIGELGAIDRIRGLDITVRSDIPIGSGLASSAALTVAFVALLNKQFDLGYDRRELAEIAYVAESQRVGTRCGRLDQYGVTFGGVIKLDCKSPYTVEQLPFTNLTFAIADSGVRHYTQDVHTERQTEINRGLKALMEHKATPRELKNKLGYTYDQPKWLEIAERDIEDFLSVLDEKAKRRILFTLKMIGLTDIALKVLRHERVSEEEVVSNFGKKTWSRVQEAASDEADYLLLGHAMNEQQALLRELYDVSLPKIEDMCTVAMAAGAYGAKISGAGMGGSIIALVKDQETGERVVNACQSVGAENGWVSSVAEGVRVGSQVSSSLRDSCTAEAKPKPSIFNHRLGIQDPKESSSHSILRNVAFGFTSESALACMAVAICGRPIMSILESIPDIRTPTVVTVRTVHLYCISHVPYLLPIISCSPSRRASSRPELNLPYKRVQERSHALRLLFRQP